MGGQLPADNFHVLVYAQCQPAGTAQGLLFLLIFRYVFGGAVSHTGGLSYVDFLVPGFVVTGVLFQGMSAASGVADDKEGGLFKKPELQVSDSEISIGGVAADAPPGWIWPTGLYRPGIR